MSEIEIVGGLLDHYTQVPNEIFRTPGIKSRAVHVFGNLRSHRSGWKTNIRNVAESTGLSNNTVMAAINDLIELGYVERVKLPPKGGRFPTYRYRVHDIPGLSFEDRPAPYQEVSREPSQKVSREPSQKVSREPVSESESIKKNSSKKTTKEDQCGASAPVADAPSPAPKKTQAHELPENWTPAPHVIKQMQEECPNIDLEAETRKFRDYWPAQPGAKSRKKDWNATWRNWIRNARPSMSAPSQVPSREERLAAWGAPSQTGWATTGDTSTRPRTLAERAGLTNQGEIEQ